MGAAKAAKATLENLSGVFQQLEREHGEVTALLLVVKATSDPAKRKELFPRIRAELLSHEKGELAEVYPAFREHANLANYAEIHEREARTLERTIEKLMAINYDDPNWGATFAELVNAVSHHVKEEEGDFFPAANRELGKDTAERLKERYLTTKAAVMAGIE
jgi:hemerythrin-like domain-containing protein